MHIDIHIFFSLQNYGHSAVKPIRYNFITRAKYARLIDVTLKATKQSLNSIFRKNMDVKILQEGNVHLKLLTIKIHLLCVLFLDSDLMKFHNSHKLLSQSTIMLKFRTAFIEV